MNRIILIGNGFDLAHGLKTSYKDFIDDFWEKEKEYVSSRFHSGIFADNGYYIYNDDFIEIKTSCPPMSFHRLVDPHAKGYDWFKSLEFFSGQIDGYISKIKYNNIFLKTITEKNYIQNWVDVEYEYSVALNNCANGNGKIDELNHGFEKIKNELEKYLHGINESVLHKQESDIINQHILENMRIDIDKINTILFLNFNYTKLYHIYERDFQIRRLNPSYFKNTEAIQIHGDLNDKENPIIFGYGDEIDKRIENMNEDKYFDYVKLIKYLHAGNNKRLFEFTDSDKYEVFVMGHSCGISDKILLKKLFEHENCSSIRIFYHQRDDETHDYYYMANNIYRNLTNKLLKEKVVPYNPSKPLSIPKRA
jgi:hypothetical protein